MTLCVKDIAGDLGIMDVTVRRWIASGKIKASLANRRTGWKIKEEDYIRFLDENPKWRLIHDGEVFKNTEIEARNNALMAVTARIISSKASLALENRSEEYRMGFFRATQDIQDAIGAELRKKTPVSHPEQMII